MAVRRPHGGLSPRDQEFLARWLVSGEPREVTCEHLAISKSTYYRIREYVTTLLRQYDATISVEDWGEDNLTRIRQTYLERIPQRTHSPAPSPPPALSPAMVAAPPAAHVFVGRTQELRQLQDAFAGVTAGRPAVFLVSGEPGIGKTALCDQLAAYVEEHQGMALAGRCDPVGSRVQPLLPFVEALDAFVRRQPSWSLARMLDFDRTEAIALADLSPQLRRLFPDAEDRLRELGALGVRWKRLRGLVELLRRASAAQPLLLVIEDLTWADDESLVLLTGLLRALRSGASPPRVMVVGTFRTFEVRPGQPFAELELEVRSNQQSGHLTLASLTPEEVRELLRRTLGSGVSRALSDLVHRQTDGNPLFVSEVARHLMDQQPPVTPAVNIALSTAEAAGWSAPKTVRDMIYLRLASLGEPCRELLRLAAVLGERFDLAHLRAVAVQDAASLAEPLQEAVERGILMEERQPYGRGTYWFRHGFTRQVLYNDIPYPRLAALHLQIAGALEQLNAEHIDEVAAVVAEHYYHSDSPNAPAKVARHGYVAARRAAASFSNTTALLWYGRSMDALDELERGGRSASLDNPAPFPSLPWERAGAAGSLDEWWVRLLKGRAEVELLLGEMGPAEQHLEEALRRCGAAVPPDTSGGLAQFVPELHYLIARVYEGLGHFDAALEAATLGLTAIGARWDDVSGAPRWTPASPAAHAQAVQLCVWRGFVQLRRTDYGDAERWAQRALALAETPVASAAADTEAARSAAQALNLMGVVARLRGQPAVAVRYHERSIAGYAALGDKVGGGRAHTNLAVALRDQGNLAGAREHFLISQGLAEDLGDPISQAAAAINLGEILTLQGELAAALAGYQSAQEVVERLGQRNFAAVAHMNRAMTYLALGDVASALTEADTALEQFAGMKAETYNTEALRYRALALLRLQRPEEARVAAHQALDNARHLGRALEEGRALRVVGQVLAAQRDEARLTEALDAFETSRRMLDSLGAHYELGLTLLERARARAAWSRDVPHPAGLRLLARQDCAAALELLQTAGAALEVAAAQELHAHLAHVPSSS